MVETVQCLEKRLGAKISVSEDSQLCAEPFFWEWKQINRYSLRSATAASFFAAIRAGM